ncbi:hypothetical protein JHFBIEKO_3496 [Methylobacterium mesophilicum]|uniref:SWIM zinc finger family protein n=1 Tax=Methylobacterium mesophilicum TaxID=39956 RepID=UPI001EE24282|nr:SWIM zinc finger family protein [Methylobacterium mesophilicum]GJE23035.1 hypothetical protein JHFBIEKO_3496 [Methylobacterium mesophilicum]
MARKLPKPSAIADLASPEIRERGLAYHQDGAVSGLVARGDTITAEVAGSEIDPYRVVLRIEDGRIAQTSCTCPYEWGGACKHVIAALLTLIEAPQALDERPPLADLLAPLDRDALVDLIQRRATSDPDLIDWIAMELTTAPHAASADGTIDPQPIADRARNLLAGHGRRANYWAGYRADGDEAELRALVEKAVPFLEAGDGRNALRILEAVAEPLVQDWLEYGYEDDETSYLLFEDLGRMMAEAVLMGDLDPKARVALRDTLAGWEARISDYGPESFAVAIQALETGWDDPALKAVLDGGPGPWPPEGADFADRILTEVRLRVLDASGQDEAYLNLARAAGAQARVAGKLARLGRIAEAVAHAEATFTSPAEALDLAQVLKDAGHGKEALAVGEAGLGLGQDEAENLELGHPNRSVMPLARWLRDEARGALARRAARTAFEATFAKADFDAAKAVAGKAWPSDRDVLLARLSEAERAVDRVAIFLDEGMIDAAVAAAKNSFGTHSSELLRLAEAAHASHPDWVIALAEARATAIMDQGQAGQYEEAATWLRCALQAYDAADRFDDWTRRIEGLIETHKRKYKLRPLLEDLRHGL